MSVSIFKQFPFMFSSFCNNTPLKDMYTKI